MKYPVQIKAAKYRAKTAQERKLSPFFFFASFARHFLFSQLRCPASAIAAVIFFATIFLQSGCSRSESATANPPPQSNSISNAPAESSVELSDEQLNAIKIEPVEMFVFPIVKTGIGSIDFENNLYSDASLSTQVFPPCEGQIIKVFVELGDEVQKGQPLYSIESSDSKTGGAGSPLPAANADDGAHGVTRPTGQDLASPGATTTTTWFSESS